MIGKFEKQAAENEWKAAHETEVKNQGDKMNVRKYEIGDLPEMIRIWNEVVDEGNAFPQEEPLDERSGAEFFAAQSYCGVAEDGEQFADCTFSTRTTSDVAGTSATQATR